MCFFISRLIHFQTKSHEISTTSSAAEIQLQKRGIQTSPDGKINLISLFNFAGHETIVSFTLIF